MSRHRHLSSHVPVRERDLPDLASSLRDEALQQVLTRLPEDDPWRRQAVPLVAQLADSGREFQAADLMALGLHDPDHSSRWGALFRLCAHHGLIERVAAAPSSRPTVRHSLTRTWRGTGHAEGLR